MNRIFALLSVTALADPSRFLMQSGVSTDHKTSLVQRCSEPDEDCQTTTEETPSSEKVFLDAMAKLRGDRDRFAQESAEYKRKSIQEHKAAMALIH